MSLAEIPCPRCHEPTRWEGNPHRPFCSDRCRLLDLGAWAEESYRIPVDAPLPPAGEGENDHD